MRRIAALAILTCLPSAACLAAGTGGPVSTGAPVGTSLQGGEATLSRGLSIGDPLPRGAVRGIPRGGVTVTVARSVPTNHVGQPVGEDCSLASGHVEVLGHDERFGTLVRYEPTSPSPDQSICAGGTIAFVDRWALLTWPPAGLAEEHERAVAGDRAAAVSRILGSAPQAKMDVSPAVTFGLDVPGR